MLSVKDGLELGVSLGWWPRFDPDKLDPHPWPWCYLIKTGELRREVYHPEYGFSLWEPQGSHPGLKYVSQVMPLIGASETVSEARKQGWGKSLEPGEIWFKKRTIHLLVETE